MSTTEAAQSTAFAILLDGDCAPTPRLRAQLAGHRVIAADGGMRHAEPLGLAPELWVGDFDSATDALMARFAHVPRQSHPARKDLSDGELAIAIAREHGARSLVLCGALGGKRSDHLLFHVPLALRLARRDRLSVLLASGTEEGHPLLPGPALEPDLPAGTQFSIVPLSDLENLTIERADWPLDNVQVAMGGSLTLSNIAHDGLRITLGQGIAMLVATF